MRAMRGIVIALCVGLAGSALALIFDTATWSARAIERAPVHDGVTLVVPAPAAPAPIAPPAVPAVPRIASAPLDRAAPADALRDGTWQQAAGVRWLEGRLPCVARGAHYRVHTDVSPVVAHEALAALEAGYARLIERFGTPRPRTIDGLLAVFIYSSRTVYERGPAQREVAWPAGRHGFYDGRGNAHLEVLADARVFLQLLTHEAVHQVHQHALGALGPKWFVEGVAHDLEWYAPRSLDALAGSDPWPPPATATGAGRLSALLEEVPVPAVHEELLLAFLALADRAPLDLAALLRRDDGSLTADEDASRALGYVLVRYLRSARAGAFADWFGLFQREVSVGRPVPALPRGLPQGAALLREVREFAIAMRPAAEISLALTWRDGRHESARGVGPETWHALAALPPEGEALRISLRAVARLGADERLGFGVLDGAGNPVTTWTVDHEAATLRVVRAGAEEDAGVRIVDVGVRVMPPFTLGCDVVASGRVTIRRGGMRMHEETLPALPVEGRVALVFRSGARSAFATRVALDDVVVERVPLR